jgi:hypothetical protein
MTQPQTATTPQDAFRAFILQIQDQAGLTNEEIEALDVPQKVGPYQIAAPFPQGPEGAGYVVFKMFVGGQGERMEDAYVPGDVRVYCIPTGAVGATGPTYPPVRYTISGLGTAHGVIRTTNMPVMDTFIDALAYELRQAAICQGLVEDDDDEDDDEGIACKNAGCDVLHDEDDKFCPGCGTPVAEAPAAAPTAVPS